MKVYFNNIREDHLGALDYPEGPGDATSRTEPWFWVVHPEDSAKEFIDDVGYSEAVKNCLNRGGGILFLKGARFAGLNNEEEAAALEREKNYRIHCLRVACSKNSPKIVERVRRFLEEIGKIGPGQPIHWERVEPAPWPESMVAIYLLFRAIEASPAAEDKIRNAWNDLDPAWRGNLWAEAWREYSEERGLNVSEWLRAGLPEGRSPAVDLPELALISKAAALLKQCLSGRR